MTVATTGNRKRYTANGATDTFSFPYHLNEKDDLLVYLDGTLKTLASHYNIAGTAPFPSGVDVVFTSDPAADVVVLLVRSTDKTQNLDLNNIGNFDQDSVETILDKNTLIAQDATGLTDEAILAPSSFTAGFRLPEPTQAVLIAWEDVATPTALVNTTRTIASFDADVTATANAKTAAEAAQAAAETAETNAETAEANAETAETNAETAETNAAASAASASASAGSASAIAGGSLYTYVEKTGSFTAEDGGAYHLSATGTITLPSIGSNVHFRLLVNPGVVATLDYTANTINGYSQDVLINAPGYYTLQSVDGSTWLLTKGESSGVYATPGTVSAIKVSSDDTTANWLENKLVAGTNITLTVNNPGASETITIDADATKAVQVTVFDYTTDTATGDGAAYIHVPASLNGMNLTTVHAEVITAGTTGTTDIQIHNVTQAADMLTTKITIDSTETGSDTAATPAVIDTANDDVATNDLLRIDVDAVSTTAAKGLIVTMEFETP